jgi:hypothetical protein
VIKLVTDENFHGAIYPERAETGTLSLSDGGQPMKTLSVRTTIGPDGSIDLHIHSDLPPGDAEIVLVVQPLGSTRTAAPPFPSDDGVWAGKLPDHDIEAELTEMNVLWEKSMELPK